MSAQSFLFNPGLARAVGSDPSIDSFTVTADGGKSAQAIGDIFYTNDTTPIITATYSDDTAINDATAAVTVGGVNTGYTVRDTSQISVNPSITPGSYSLVISVSDTDGNTTTLTKTLVVDTTTPAAPVISVPTDSTTSNDQTPDVTGTAEANVAVKIFADSVEVGNGLSDGSGNFSVTTSTLANGAHNLTAQAIDFAGNESGLSTTVSYTVDIIAPTMPTQVPVADGHDLRPTLSWTDEDVSAVNYHLQISADDFATFITDTTTATLSYTPISDLPNGTISWRVSAFDIYGNESPFQDPADSFVVDSVLPAVTSVDFAPVSPVGAGSFVATIRFSKEMNQAVSPVVSFGLTEPYSDHSLETSWTDGATLSAIITIPSGGSWDGLNTVSISGAFDLFGNEMMPNNSYSFVIDTTAPVIALNGDAVMTVEAGSSYTELGADWTDAVDGSGAAVVGGDTVDVNTVGDYTVTYNYTDMAGNVAVQVTRLVHVVDTQAPAIFGQTPVDVTTSDAFVPVSATFADAGSGVDTSSLELYINSIPVTSYSFVGDTFTYIPVSGYDDGNYTVEVSIADNIGNRTDIATWNFAVSSAPTIDSVVATGGRSIGGYFNSTNTGLTVSGTVVADSGIQTIGLYVNGAEAPLATTVVAPALTTYAIILSPEQLADLASTEGTKSLQVKRIGSTSNNSALSASYDLVVDTIAPAMPDSEKISLSQNPLGIDDTIAGVAGTFDETTSSVFLYQADGVTTIGSYSVNPDGSFGPVSIGDNTNDTVLVAARDAAGNESSTVAFYNDIVAPDAPVISTPADGTVSNVAIVTVSGAAESNAKVKIYDGATYFGETTADGGGAFSLDITLTDNQTYNFVAKSFDAAGNPSLDSNTVSYLFDNIAPTGIFTSPAVLTNTGDDPITVTWSDAGAGFSADPTRTLQYGPIYFDTVWDGVDTMTYTPSGSSSAGSYTLVATITDQAGNVGTLEFTFTIDTIAPVIAAHDDVTVEATSATGANVNYDLPQVTDNNDAPTTATCTPDTGSLFALGDTTVNCTASDTAGNAATPTSFAVHVVDTTAPVIEITGDNPMTIEVHGSYTELGAVAHDTVDGDFAATPSGSVDVDTLGTYYINYDATDLHGNVATTVTRTVNVVDTTTPVIAAHGDEIIESTSALGAIVNYLVPNTTDNYDADAPAICAPDSGSQFSLGHTTVTCTKTDSSGNEATPTSFDVWVRDTTAPSIDSIIGTTGTTGETTTVTVNASDAVGTTSAQISFDGGSSWLDMTGTTSPFTYDVLVPTDSTASINYDVMVFDTAGNSITSTTQTITVTDNDAPSGTLAVRASTTTNISDPELYARTTALKLTTNASDNIGVATMSFKDDHSTDWSVPVVYTASTTYAYSLSSSTDGARTVYAKYCDAQGNCLETIDQILFDNNAPSALTGLTDGIITNNKQLEFSWNSTTDLPSGLNSGLQYYLVTVQKQNPDTTWSDVAGLVNLNASLVTSYQLSSVQAGGLTDGVYRANIKVRDNAGNTTGAKYSDGVILDTTAPVILLNGTTPVMIEKGDSYIELGAGWTDAVDGSGVAVVGGDSVDTDTVGTYILTYNYTDAAGNAAVEVTRTVNVVDTTAPVLGEITPVTTPTNNPVYTFTSNEAGTIQYTGACATTTATTTASAGVNEIALTGLGSGTYSDCAITVTDAYDNASLSLPILEFVIDKDAPTVTIDTLVTKDSTPELTGTIDDPAATIIVTVNGHDYTATNNGATWTADVTETLSDGTYDVVATATDAVGNSATDATTDELKVDNVAPIVVSATPTGSTDNHMPTIIVTFSDAIADIKSSSLVMRINGVAVTAAYNATDKTLIYTPSRNLGSRTYTVTIDGTDNAGNTMTRYSFSFTVL